MPGNPVEIGPLNHDQNWTAMVTRAETKTKKVGQNLLATLQREMDRENKRDMVKENTAAKQNNLKKKV